MKNTLKRVLTLVLGLALIASCMTGLTLVASAEEEPEGYFNGFEDSVADFSAKYGGSISQDDNGVDGKCLVYESKSAYTWYAPYMTAAATKAAFPEVGVYTVSFDIKTSVVISGDSELKGRGSASLGLDNVHMASFSLKNRAADTWYHIEQNVTFTQAMADDSTFQFGLDAINNDAENKVYLDNFSVVRVNKPAAISLTGANTVRLISAPAVGPFAGLTADDFDSETGLATVRFLAYNPNSAALTVKVAENWAGTLRKAGTATAQSAGESIPGAVTSNTIAANETKILTYKIPAAADILNSSVLDVNGFANVSYKQYSFRIDGGASGQKLYLYAYENLLVNDSLVAFAGGATAATVAEGLNEQYYGIYKNKKKSIFNGDAENGLVGWSVFSAAGGNLELSTDTTDGTGHSVKYTPNGQYASVGFDLASAIVNKPELLLQGAGAGKYVIEFDAKLQEGYSGAATVTINSQNHQGANADLGLVNTYSGGSAVTLTDQWQHFTATVSVSQSMLDTLDYWYDAGRSNSYDLILRLDAASGFLKTERPYYFIDNVTIGMSNAVQFDVQATTSSPYYGTKAGYLSSILGYASDYTGDVTVSYEFYNASALPVKTELSIQATLKNSAGGDTWASYNNTNTMKVIAPLTSETLTFTMPVVNGMVATASPSLQAASVSMANFWVRFNFVPVTTMEGKVAANLPAKMYVIPSAEKPGDLVSQKQYLSKMTMTEKYFTGEETIDARILGANVAISEDLTVNFYTNVPGTMILNGKEISAVYENDSYKFSYNGVNPQCMGDEISGTFTDLMGDTLDVPAYSVKAYCENMAAKQETGALLKTLMADMLEYGAAAQNYVDYKTDALVNDVEALSSCVTTGTEKPASLQSSEKEPGYTARIKSMTLKLSNKLNLIANVESEEEWYVEVFAGEDLTTPLVDNQDYICTPDYILIPNLPAQNINTKYTIKVYVGQDLQNTVTYSMSSYISSKWESNTVGELVQALYNYGNAIVAYAASLS